MKILIYPCKKFFFFSTVNHRWEFLTPEEPGFFGSDVSTAIFEKNPLRCERVENSTTLPGLCSSQILCWFQPIQEQSRTWVQTTHGCRSSRWGCEHRTCPSSPSSHRGLASRDRKLLDLPGEGKEMNTHGGGQDLAKEAEIIFEDQNKEWVKKRKVGAVKTTGTKKEAMDGEGNGGTIDWKTYDWKTI
ncbi:hypothetical protein DUI87_15866 [Hirundo rustica rustica]|uniref:Uncharacterized protein n=1 Tax=Hirundo rustica rustica TaxID=333673 RepID=A0A3M0JZP7_HIRRU|nr:hypothetical protein DUI87_15866 [Hirundo rustica rustica]